MSTHPDDSASGPRLGAMVTTEYLDLDGDGVPDAVRTVHLVGVDLTLDGVADVVETMEELATGIDITGEPEAVRVVDTIERRADERPTTITRVSFASAPPPGAAGPVHAPGAG